MVTGKQILETLHFIALAVQVGAIMVISLRLLGIGRGVPLAALQRPVFRTAWLAFAAVLITGTLQFIPIAAEALNRPSFQAKIAILCLALATLVWLQTQVRRNANDWDAGTAIPGSLRIAAILSLILWPTVIIVARLMYAFVQMGGVREDG
jgi:hypothetical protein